MGVVNHGHPRVSSPPDGHQWRYTRRQLECLPPGVRSGEISSQVELHLRSQIVRRIVVLKESTSPSPQLATATATAYIHRFFMTENVQDYNIPAIAAAAFFLASKLEESGKRLRDIVGMTLALNALKQPGVKYAVSDDPESLALTKKILYYEFMLLQVLGYDLRIQGPYVRMQVTLESMWRNQDSAAGLVLARIAWSFLNDSLFFPSCLLHRPNVISAASIVCAYAQLDLDLPPRAEFVTSEHLRLSEEMDEGEIRENTEEAVYWLDDLEVTIDEAFEALEDIVGLHLRSEDEYIRVEAARLMERASRYRLL